MNRLENRVAFITGGGTGIGRQAALLFAGEGAKIVIADLDSELGKESEQLIQAAGGEALFVATNVTDEDSVRAAVTATIEKFDKLDLLYNCAGGSIGDDGAITNVEPWVIDHTLSLDLKGTLFCCRHAIPEIIKAGGGSVVNMSSTAALQGTPMHIYSAAKGAIISLTKSLAATYTQDLIRVNAICPGIVLTDRVKLRFGDLPEKGSDAGDSIAARTANRYPFGVGHPDDIAQVALFLAADESRMVNGTVVVADGGMSAF
ncbi:MAG: SDR family oxidoreductase [Gammaproteobacteria bacterium]|nr:SDR family oxidoreductase [Gammaproteobacteria bacterium]